MSIAGLGKRKPRIQRDWTMARAKLDDEGYRCRRCGGPGVEAAHIIGREHDSKQPVTTPWLSTVKWKPWLVWPTRIIPLCHECHQGPNGHHARRLDIGPLLSTGEQVQAVADAGSVADAYRLLYPTEIVR
jgi:hypothetical protein